MDSIISKNYSQINRFNVSRETCNELESLIRMIQKKNKEINIISKKKSKYIWMNARQSAVKFYLNLGYINSNKTKIIGNIGLHYMLFKYL